MKDEWVVWRCGACRHEVMSDHLAADAWTSVDDGSTATLTLDELREHACPI